MLRVAFIVATCLWAIHAASAQDDDAMEVALSAPAQPTYTLDTPPGMARLDFDFRNEETRAWLNREGDFQVQGWVQHSGLVCATYRMGLRFGVGAPGCLNVEWLGDARFVTNQIQCNNARVEHMGGDDWNEMGERIGSITCAERVVRCMGNCK